MKSMIISEFKAKCIAVLKEAQQSNEPVLVTRRGVPIARIEPIRPAAPARQLGALRGRLRIKQDLVHADFDAEWEAGR